jgi:hypothetical protein
MTDPLATAARRYFDSLSPEGQAAAIRRMRREGMGVYTLASATGLSIEAIRAILRGGMEPHRGDA